jgi:hypothetical protein
VVVAAKVELINDVVSRQGKQGQKIRFWLCFPKIRMWSIIRSLTVSRLFSPIAVLSAFFSFLAASFRSQTSLQMQDLGSASSD